MQTYRTVIEPSIETAILVFDIGKTHVKVTVVDARGDILYQNRTSNDISRLPPYDSYDVEAIWLWLLGELAKLSPLYNIMAISIATHGAAAALVNPGTEELLLPVMDYEFEAYPEGLPDYDALRPPFEHSGSPDLPGGLNLGRQLNWQSALLSDAEKKTAALLLYPQYWAWRLTGKLAAEITSLGCHTDLWDVTTNSPSPVLKGLGLEHALPPIKKAWQPLGTIKQSLASDLGLNSNCAVYPGIHDSNAGYVSILKTPKDTRPAVISTGTWSVIMDPHADISRLNPAHDMLVNIDAEGAPLATARYMGGRAFALICERLNTDIATTFTDSDIENIIRSNTFILPSFCAGTGPYPGAQNQIYFENPKSPINGKAAASLYSALMITNILKKLSPRSKHDILIEGSFAANSVLCSLLAALNPGRAVRTQSTTNGVTEGCYLLTRWDSFKEHKTNPVVTPYPLNELHAYAARWEAALLRHLKPGA